MTAREILCRVWGKGEGYAFLATGKDGSFRQTSFAYPEDLDNLLAAAKEYNRTGNVWFCIHLSFDKELRRKSTAKKVSCLWIDLDESRPELVEPRPTIAWQTSAGRSQAVWILDAPVAPALAESVNKELTLHNKGDRGKWALTTLLRIPETVNHKYTPPQEGFILWDDGPEYAFAELQEYAEHFAAERSTVADLPGTTLVDIEHPLPTALPSLTQVMFQYGSRLNKRIWNALNTLPRADEDWSTGLWELEKLLFECGLPKEAVFVLVRESPWNKYARDKRPDADLWKEVLKAQEGIAAEITTPSLVWLGMDTLMTHAERPQWLVEEIWMDKNVGWLAGEGKSYKSTLSLDLALSVASGEPFLGKFPVHSPGPVLMVQEEDPLWRVALRVQLMAQAKGYHTSAVLDEPDGMTFLSTRRPLTDIPLHVTVGSGFAFVLEEKVEALEEAILKIRPKMVFLDPMFMISMGMDEFKASEITPLLVKLKKWRNEYGCSIAIVHHYRKGTGTATERLYGSGALHWWSENSLFFERLDRKDGAFIVIRREIKDAEPLDPLTVQLVGDLTERYEVAVTARPDKEDHRKDIFRILEREGTAKIALLSTELTIPKTRMESLLKKLVAEGTVYASGVAGDKTYGLTEMGESVAFEEEDDLDERA